jgi:hypothetical protein
MLFLIVHMYVLIHFVLFAGKVGLFHAMGPNLRYCRFGKIA